MPKLKVLSGKEIIAIFIIFRFLVIAQKGSHVKLKRVINDKKETLTIPNHNELDKGTVKAIYNQARIYISEKDLKKYFYSE